MKLAEKRALKKKEEILMAAVAIVNRRGYSGATMEEIAADLLMTKGALYYYFKNKGELMFQCHNLVLSTAFEEQQDHLQKDGSAEEILRNMIITHIDYAIEEKETFNLISKPEQIFTEEQLAAVLELRKSYSRLFDRIIERGVENGEFRVEEPLIARMILLGSMNWIQQWYRPEGRLSKEELQKTFGDFIVKLVR